jgi:streptogramin lyase
MAITFRTGTRVLAAAALGAVLLSSLSAQSGSSSRTYTLNADFDQGLLLNLNHVAATDQLQINGVPAPLPLLSAAATARGTLLRIHIASGAPVGEYKTAPGPIPSPLIRPSAIAVDRLGNTWVANRGDVQVTPDGTTGSITRIGALLGGSRTDVNGVPDPTGEYVSPPFVYNTCVDRDDDGRIRTSPGLARPPLSWTNANGADTLGGVSTADDECILDYTRVAGAGPRAVAVDAANDLWVGGTDDQDHELVDGLSGLPVPGTLFNVGAGGGSAVIDQRGRLWSAGNGTVGSLLRFVPGSGHDADVVLGNASGEFGLALDPTTGDVWLARSQPLPSPRLTRFKAGGSVQSVAQPFAAQGIVIDARGHVWVAESRGRRLWHLAPTAGGFTQLTTAPFVAVTGLAVDTNGAIWGIEGPRLTRVNPVTGNIERVFNFPAGSESYGDLTGFVALAAHPSGVWAFVHEGPANGTQWGTIAWTGETPARTSIVVEVRASDSQAGLSREAFRQVANGEKFNGVAGRFLEVRTILAKAALARSPVLFDLTVRANRPPVASCANARTGNDLGLCAAPAPSIDSGSFDPDHEPLTIVQRPSGPLRVGAHSSRLTATDGSGARDSCTAKVTILDVEPPSIVCPPAARVECVHGKGSFTPVAPRRATDNCAEFTGLTVTTPSADSFRLGTTPLVYHAIDGAGLESTCTSSVTVVDTQAPKIVALAAAPSHLFPANHRLVPVALRALTADACRGTSASSCRITSVTSNEKSAPSRGRPDWIITGRTTLELRAERNGSGTGRVYTIGVACSDANGNTATATARVIVPHDRRRTETLHSRFKRDR